jgi:hypothetical protein
MMVAWELSMGCLIMTTNPLTAPPATRSAAAECIRAHRQRLDSAKERGDQKRAAQLQAQSDENSKVILSGLTSLGLIRAQMN